MAKTNTGLVEYAKAQVGKPYWYGTFGQTASESLYNSKKKQYPYYYNYNDFASQYGQRVHDCSGLIKGYLYSSSPTAQPKYVGEYDKSAYGFYLAATKRGDKSSFPYVNGTLVFKSYDTKAVNIHHIGVYCTDGYVYEAKGHEWGVVKTKFNPSDWQFWAYCSYITYEDTTTAVDTNKPSSTGKKSIDEIAKEVIQGKYGNGAERKSKLQAAGYNYDEVQNRVNQMLNVTATTSKKSNEEIAKEVIRGDWGNGADRKNRLTKAGYDYNAIQSLVNKMI